MRQIETRKASKNSPMYCKVNEFIGLYFCRKDMLRGLIASATQKLCFNLQALVKSFLKLGIHGKHFASDLEQLRTVANILC